MSDRITHARMYQGRLWLRHQADYLSKHTVCKCGAPATEVAHTRRHRGCWREFLDPQTQAPACAACLPIIEGAAK